MDWLKARLINGSFYLVIILAVLLGLYKLFLAPTSKTVNTAPSTHVLDNPTYAPMSCARIIVAK